MKRILVFATVLSFWGIMLAKDTMQFTDWSDPASLGPVVNSDYRDSCPIISKSGLSLYFESDRPDPDAQGNCDIYVSQRDSLEDPWEAPVNLGPTINSPYLEGDPAFSTDGHWMIFVSNRPGGCGMIDMYISHRKDKWNDFGWETPVNLGCIVNTPTMDIGPYLFNDETTDQTLLYYSSGTYPRIDIYVSRFSNETGTFEPPIPVAELNTESAEWQPTLRKDGLEIFFARGVPGYPLDLYVATRETTQDLWSMPVNLTSLNSTENEFRPTLSWDGTTLIFASERVGKQFDLFMSTRTKLHPKK
jgi:hypothetical protein